MGCIGATSCSVSLENANNSPLRLAPPLLSPTEKMADPITKSWANYSLLFGKVKCRGFTEGAA
jgi:hypothetical protein